MAMANSIWGTGHRLDESLFQKGYEFEFFQAVRLLILLENEGSTALRVRDVRETLRFAIHPSLSFPTGSIAEIDRLGHGSSPRVRATFWGLLGCTGVLPLAYTETAIHQASRGDDSFAAFFDIFHHRLLSLVYQAWEKHHFVVGYEKSCRDRSSRDAFTGYLLDLIGMGTKGLENRLPFADTAMLRYAGLLAQRPRSAECLRALLHDFLGVPVRVEQFVGRWHPLEPDEHCALGEAAVSSQLGAGTLAGDMVWSRQATIRVALGPVSAGVFWGFLPNGERFRETAALVRWFLGPTIEFELQPILPAGEIPHWCKLGNRDEAGPMLGWCTWIGDEPFPFPAREAVFAERDCVSGSGETAQG